MCNELSRSCFFVDHRGAHSFLMVFVLFFLVRNLSLETSSFHFSISFSSSRRGAHLENAPRVNRIATIYPNFTRFPRNVAGFTGFLMGSPSFALVFNRGSPNFPSYWFSLFCFYFVKKKLFIQDYLFLLACQNVKIVFQSGGIPQFLRWFEGLTNATNHNDCFLYFQLGFPSF